MSCSCNRAAEFGSFADEEIRSWLSELSRGKSNPGQVRKENEENQGENRLRKEEVCKLKSMFTVVKSDGEA